MQIPINFEAWLAKTLLNRIDDQVQCFKIRGTEKVFWKLRIFCYSRPIFVPLWSLSTTRKNGRICVKIFCHLNHFLPKQVEHFITANGLQGLDGEFCLLLSLSCRTCLDLKRFVEIIGVPKDNSSQCNAKYELKANMNCFVVSRPLCRMQLMRAGG